MAAPITASDRQIGREIAEPAPWPFDGDLARRANVMDPNFDPPRLVRRVGWIRCLRCADPHFSPDVAGVRICLNCKNSDEENRGRGARLL